MIQCYFNVLVYYLLTASKPMFVKLRLIDPKCSTINSLQCTCSLIEKLDIFKRIFHCLARMGVRKAYIL